jgi:hypothetical protein
VDAAPADPHPASEKNASNTSHRGRTLSIPARITRARSRVNGSTPSLTARRSLRFERLPLGGRQRSRVVGEGAGLRQDQLAPRLLAVSDRTPGFTKSSALTTTGSDGGHCPFDRNEPAGRQTVPRNPSRCSFSIKAVAGSRRRSR